MSGTRQVAVVTTPMQAVTHLAEGGADCIVDGVPVVGEAGGSPAVVHLEGHAKPASTRSALPSGLRPVVRAVEPAGHIVPAAIAVDRAVVT